MDNLPRIPRGGYPFKLPPQTIVLEHWQTPAFCRRAVKDEDVHGDQAKRYKAIVRRRDWDKKRNWPLVWLEPPGDENGDQVPVEREPMGDSGSDVDKWYQMNGKR